MKPYKNPDLIQLIIICQATLDPSNIFYGAIQDLKMISLTFSNPKTL